MSLKKIKENLNKWKDSLCSWILQIPYYLRWQIDLYIHFNFFKIPAGFFSETDKLILKYMWKFESGKTVKKYL